MEAYKRKNKGKIPSNLKRLNAGKKPPVENTPSSRNDELRPCVEEQNLESKKKAFVSDDESSSSSESEIEEDFDEILLQHSNEPQVAALSKQVEELKHMLESVSEKKGKHPKQRKVVKKYYIQRGGEQKNNSQLIKNIKHKILNF